MNLVISTLKLIGFVLYNGDFDLTISILFFHKEQLKLVVKLDCRSSKCPWPKH